MLLSNDQGSVPSTVRRARQASARPESFSLSEFIIQRAWTLDSGVAFFWGFFANGRLDGRPFAFSVAEFHE